MRVCILGCGSIGRRHLQNLLALEAASDVSVFDPAPAVCAEARADFGVYCSDNLDEIWARAPQVALVAAPSNLHTELATEAARRGCHLFIEKPLAHTLRGLDELLGEAERRRLVTMVGCNMRFHPGPATVKRLLEEGRVGRTIAARIQGGSYLPRWRPAQDYRASYSASPAWGGAILDYIHELDLTLWYFGAATLVAAAQLPATTIGLECEGLAEILLHHTNGVLSSVHLNFVQRDYRRGCQIIGSDGTIYWDFMTKRIDIYGADGALAESVAEPSGWQLNQMYVDELEHFLNCVATGAQTVNPLANGLATLEIALAARDKATRL